MIEDEELWDEFVRTRSPKLREKLILKHLDLVRNALFYDGAVQRQSYLEPEDLFIEGVIGLIQAVDRFDPSQGFKFLTYAHWRIEGQIKDALRKASFGKRRLLQDLHELMGLIAQSPNATDKEITQALRITPRRLGELRGFRGEDILSLNVPIEPDSKVMWVDFLRDPGKSPGELYESEEFWSGTWGVLNAFSVRDRRVFKLYFIEGYNMRETSEIVGVSESRISQIIAKELRMIRAWLRREKAHE